MSLDQIEKTWEVSKILVTENANAHYLAYLLGKHDIYVHKMRPIITSLDKSISECPHMVDVRSREQETVQAFVLGEPQFKAYKIFKHGNGFYNVDDCVGLAANTIKNLLHLFKEPVTFYIDSKDREIRKQFYDIALRINEDDVTEHKFDYEEYDYRLLIKKYDTYMYDAGPVFTGFSLFAILTGTDMPNAWRDAYRE